MQSAHAKEDLSQGPSAWVQDRQDRLLIGFTWGLALALTVLDWEIVTGGLFIPGFQLQWMVIISVSLYVLVKRMRLAQLVAQQINFGMILVLGWALASTSWSPIPSFTLTQAICIIGVSMMGFSFGLTAWNRHRFETVMAATVLLLLAASAIVCLVAPDISIHKSNNPMDNSLSNAWHGVTYQKNALGRLATLGVILWSYLLMTRRLHWGLAWAGIALSFLVLLKSRSNTSLMLALLTVPLMAVILRPVVNLGWFGGKFMFGSIIVGVPVAIYLVVLTPTFQWLSEFFGKGTSFTGRTFIWEAVVAEIGKHPVVGIGFSSFWRGPDSPAAAVIEKVNFNVNSAHNGFLDVTNELGLVGLLLLLAFLVLHTRALSLLARYDRERFALHSGLFLLLVLSNIAESGFLRTVTTVHLVMMYSSMEVTRLLFYYRVLSPSASRAPPESVEGVTS